jgi:hypothetical protein
LQSVPEGLSMKTVDKQGFCNGMHPNAINEHRTSNPRVGSSNLSERATPTFATLHSPSPAVAATSRKAP